MTIEKLKSGSYRISKMVDGKRYRLTIGHKPSKREAEELIGAEVKEAAGRPVSELAFREAAEKYVEMKKNVLSPSSVREYRRKIGRLSEAFTGMVISDISPLDIQAEINDITPGLSPKTVSDMNSFIQAVLKAYQPGYVRCDIRLPQKRKPKEAYIPTPSDMERIRIEAKGTQYDIAIELGILGLRRSEICALTASDVDGRMITIDKAMVQDDDNEWVIKSTKNTSSERRLAVPQELADRIRERGRAYEGFPGAISNFLRRVQDKLGMPHFSLHKERHYFATRLSELNVPEADILKMGGWSTDHVMKEVYRHATIDRDMERMKELSDKLLG